MRRKTVEALMRQHLREKEQLLGLIREQNNQIMYLAGRTWEAPPSEPPLEVQDESGEGSYPNATDLVEDF